MPSCNFPDFSSAINFKYSYTLFKKTTLRYHYNKTKYRCTDTIELFSPLVQNKLIFNAENFDKIYCTFMRENNLLSNLVYFRFPS